MRMYVPEDIVRVGNVFNQKSPYKIFQEGVEGQNFWIVGPKLYQKFELNSQGVLLRSDTLKKLRDSPEEMISHISKEKKNIIGIICNGIGNQTLEKHCDFHNINKEITIQRGNVWSIYRHFSKNNN